jgi:glutaredoxin
MRVDRHAAGPAPRLSGTQIAGLKVLAVPGGLTTIPIGSHGQGSRVWEDDMQPDRLDERPEISVYWQPGCSSCLKVKEFLEEQGLFFESLNVIENRGAMDDLIAAGLRGIPVVRKGTTFIYANSLDEVAKLLEIDRHHVSLPRDELLARWSDILELSGTIIRAFDPDSLGRQISPDRDRKVGELGEHVFQIAEAFMRQTKEAGLDERQLYQITPHHAQGRDALLAYIDRVRGTFADWVSSGRAVADIPERFDTFYGNHPALKVLERGVWHSTQHARQLDVVAAGSGAEFRIASDFYQGLPLPKRLWA